MADFQRCQARGLTLSTGTTFAEQIGGTQPAISESLSWGSESLSKAFRFVYFFLVCWVAALNFHKKISPDILPLSGKILIAQESLAD